MTCTPVSFENEAEVNSPLPYATESSVKIRAWLSIAGSLNSSGDCAASIDASADSTMFLHVHTYFLPS
jgi:hypothetical protein